MIMFRGAYYPIYYFDSKELDYSTGDDGSSQEDVSEDSDLQDVLSGEDDDEYGDESMMEDSQAYGDAGESQMSPTLSQAIEDEEYYAAAGESVEYEDTTYEDARNYRRSSKRGRR